MLHEQFLYHILRTFIFKLGVFLEVPLLGRNLRVGMSALRLENALLRPARALFRSSSLQEAPRQIRVPALSGGGKAARAMGLVFGV